MMEEMYQKLKEDLIKSTHVQASGCWDWTGRQKRGLGVMRHKGQDIAAHRLMYMCVNSLPDIKGIDVVRTCDSKLCIHPEHLQKPLPLNTAKRVASPLIRMMAEQVVAEIRRYGSNVAVFRSKKDDSLIRSRTTTQGYVKLFESSELVGIYREGATVVDVTEDILEAL